MRTNRKNAIKKQTSIRSMRSVCGEKDKEKKEEEIRLLNTFLITLEWIKGPKTNTNECE